MLICLYFDIKVGNLEGYPNGWLQIKMKFAGLDMINFMRENAYFWK